MPTNRSATRVIENSAARARPAATSASRCAAPSSTVRRASASAVGVAGRHQQRFDVVARHRAVPVDVGGDDRRAGRHCLEQHHPERLAVDRREAGDGRPAQPAGLLLLADSPEPVDVRELAAAQLRGLRAVAHHPEHRVALEARERVEEHGEALALLVAADEQDRGAIGS